jgi:hypothetical protein
MKRVLIPGSLIVAGGLVAVLIFELLLRAIGYSAPVWYRPDAQLGWTLRPGAAGWFTREGHAFVKVNSAGQRDLDYPLAKPDGVYRIAVLGDSYAEAMHVQREEAFWALLPGRLHACGFEPGKRIEVLNFGVSGYGTAQEYLVLESAAARYRPDLVLLQFTNGNDVRNNSAALEDEKARPFFTLQADGGLRIDQSFAASPRFSENNSLTHEFVRRISDHSRVVQLVRNFRNVPLVQKAHANGNDVEQGLEALVLAEPRERSWDEAWRITEGLIAKTADQAKRNGAKFLVITVPYAIQVHPDRQVRAALQAKLGVRDLFYPDRRIAAFSQAHGIAALPLAYDMQRLAEERRAYYHGFPNIGMGRGHWNPEGHRIAADLIARHLCAQPS